jgi:hypothetical protein
MINKVFLRRHVYYISAIMSFYCYWWISTTVVHQCEGFSFRPHQRVYPTIAPYPHGSMKRLSTSPLWTKQSIQEDDKDDLLCAAVLVPGFLTGAAEFQPLCQTLTERGLPTVAVPMPNWHWLPCLGGRSARPILERIDFTVKHLIANHGDATKVPNFDYSLRDTWIDFRNNPGGIFQVGGSSKVEDYPKVEPQGKFPKPENLPNKKVALIGHR